MLAKLNRKADYARGCKTKPNKIGKSMKRADPKVFHSAPLEAYVWRKLWYSRVVLEPRNVRCHLTKSWQISAEMHTKWVALQTPYNVFGIDWHEIAKYIWHVTQVTAMAGYPPWMLTRKEYWSWSSSDAVQGKQMKSAFWWSPFYLKMSKQHSISVKSLSSHSGTQTNYMQKLFPCLRHIELFQILNVWWRAYQIWHFGMVTRPLGSHCMTELVRQMKIVSCQNKPD